MDSSLMSGDWWSESMGPWFGAIGGGLGALAGIFGALVGILAPRGIGKPVVVGVAIGWVVLGVVLLIAGLVALVLGQPWHVWFPLGLGGLIFTAVLGGLLPVILMRYAEAEQRRLAAAELRR